MSLIRVALVDDQPLLRLGFRLALDSQSDIIVAGEASNGQEAVEAAARLIPDVIVMDVRMPVMDGIAATARIIQDQPQVKVLILTTFDLDEYAFAGLRAGASGFLLKDAPPAELVAAIRTVAAGDAVVAPRVTRRLLDTFASRLPVDPATHPKRQVQELTARESEVLSLVATGATNAEIALALVVSEATVKTHVSRILAKLGLRDRVQAVIFAYESRLVEPS